MGLLSWICKCGRVNTYKNAKCSSCGTPRWIGERKENLDLRKVAKKPPRRWF